jgi:hypothetical protein
VPLYYCPSDRPGALWKGDIYWRARGNYVINWAQIAISNCRSQGPPPCPAYNPPDASWFPKYGLPPFGFQDLVSPYLPKQTSFKDFTDGTSYTMLLSEVIQAASDDQYDIRGDMLNDDTPCTMFMTINTPNAGVDVSVFQPPTPNPENPPYTNVGAAWMHKSARSRGERDHGRLFYAVCAGRNRSGDLAGHGHHERLGCRSGQLMIMNWRTLELFLLSVILGFAAAGCSSDSSHGTVRGTVTLDGAPLANGLIRFVPADGQSPAGEATITNGKYSAKVQPGDKRIEIMAPKIVGQRKVYETPDSPTVDRVEELLPARYNTRTELTATVTPGQQQKDFELNGDSQ